MTILAIAICSVFAVLSLLHVHWALGGRFGSAAVIPEVGGRLAFTPGVAVTLLVAAALAACAALVAAASGLVATPLPAGWLRGAMYALALVLLLRAIGDFRLVGFTKRIRGTRFARSDDLVYSPLCLTLAASVALLAAYSPS